MWFKGSKTGVAIWYVLWGRDDGLKNFEGYQTLNGLAKWFIKPEYRDMPIQRVGRIVTSPNGVVEEQTWNTRAEFVAWARPHVGFVMAD